MQHDSSNKVLLELFVIFYYVPFTCKTGEEKDERFVVALLFYVHGKHLRSCRDRKNKKEWKNIGPIRNRLRGPGLTERTSVAKYK